METINNKLINFYFELLKDKKIICRFSEGFEGPQLMSCWEEFYNQANKKILFIGQEPFGSASLKNNTLNEIEKLMSEYIEFNMSYNPQNKPRYRKPSTPFWRSVYEINEIINPELKKKPCFLWSNVSKYCTEEGGSIPMEEYKSIVKEINFLPGEIKITSPDIIIFFSGPSYDDRIRIQIEGIKFEKIYDDIPVKELAKVIHPDLPKNSFRTYHPNALQRQNKWNYLQLIAASILKDNIPSLLTVFDRQVRALSETLSLEKYLLQIDENASMFSGQKDSGFYFYKPGWLHCAIGFEFESSGYGNFFLGVCRKNIDEEIPYYVRENIKQKLGEGDGNPTDNWAWWKWFREESELPWNHKNWNHETFTEIETGELIKKIEDKLKYLLEKVADIEL